MTYVIAEPCIDVKDKSCIEECPVDCIYEGDRMLYVQPDEGDVAHQGADVGRSARGAERLFALGEERGVGGGELLPLGRHVVVVEDGLHRADRLAGAAVHALVGVDVEHAVALVDAVDRAFLDAGIVLDVDAGLGDDVGHRSALPMQSVCDATVWSPPLPGSTATPARQGRPR